MIATNNRRINEFAERLVAAVAALPHSWHPTEGREVTSLYEVFRTIRAEAAKPDYQEPNIVPMLDLSTAHLSPAAMAWLDNCGEANVDSHHLPANFPHGGPISTMGVTMCGYFMHAPEERRDGMPEELAAICTYARSLGVAYILFDRDADEIEALPTWEDDGTKIEAGAPSSAELMASNEVAIDTIDRQLNDRDDYGLGAELADMSVLSEPEARSAGFGQKLIDFAKSNAAMRGPIKAAFTETEVRQMEELAERLDPMEELAEPLPPDISEAMRTMTKGRDFHIVSGRPWLASRGILKLLERHGVDAGLMQVVGERLRDNARERLEERSNRGVIKTTMLEAAGLIEEAVTEHIYDEKNGDVIPDDDAYVLMVKRLRADAELI